MTKTIEQTVTMLEMLPDQEQNFAESAEHLDVTEEFLMNALSYYKSKYGKYASVDNYIIFFEPSISVLELM